MSARIRLMQRITKQLCFFCSARALDVCQYKQIISGDKKPWFSYVLIIIFYFVALNNFLSNWCKVFFVAPVFPLHFNHLPNTQNICITFIQRRPNVLNVCPTLCKCCTNVLCLLGWDVNYGRCHLKVNEHDLIYTMPKYNSWNRTSLILLITTIVVFNLLY